MKLKNFPLKSMGLAIFVLGGFLVLGGSWPVKAMAAPAPSGGVVPPYDGEVRIQWTPEPLATAYLIRKVQVAPLTSTPTQTPTPPVLPTPQSPTATPTFTPSPTDFPTVAAGSTLELIDLWVTNGKGYRYDLFSLDAVGTPTPNSILVTPFAKPRTVATLTTSSQYSGSIQLSWGDAASTFPVSYYRIYRYTLYYTPTDTTTPSSPTATATPTWPLGTNTPIWTNSPTPPQGAFTAGIVLTAFPTPIGTTTTTQYFDSTASAGPAGYYYLVQAVDSQGHTGDFSAYTSKGALAQVKPPFAPQLSLFFGPSPTPNIAGGVRLIWDGPAASENVTSYQVFRNGAAITTLAAVPGAPQTFNDLGLTSAMGALNVSYYLFLSNGSGSVTTNTVSAVLLRPSIAGGVRATPDANKVTLSWNQSSNGTYGLGGYRVYKSLQGIPTGTSTITPTLVADLAAVPTVTGTPYFVDTPTTNASGLSYWVVPYDIYNFSGPLAASTPSVLRLAPTPVGNVSATGPTGNNRINVSWTNAGNGFYGPPVAYSIYRAGPALLTPTLIATVTVPILSYQDVLPGSMALTPVAYRVAASDVLGNSSDLSNPSNAVTANSAVTAAAPSGIQVEGDGVSLVFSWPNNPAGDAVTEYQVYGPDFPTTLHIGPTPSGISVAQPNPGYFQPVVNYLVAVNAAGSSEPATLGGISVPTYQVTAVVPTPTHEVNLSWNLIPTAGSTVPFLDGYRIYRAPSTTPTFVPIATVSLGTLVYLDSSAQAGESYLYRVTLKSGITAESPLYPTTTPDPVGSALVWPKAPSGLASSSGSLAATLRWLPNTSGETVSSYGVYQAGNLTPIATVLPATTPQFVVTLTPGVRIGFEVSARNAGGEGSFSQPLSILGPPAITPVIALVPPTGVTATATPGLVWVSGFGYSGDVTGFDLYRSTSSVFAWEQYRSGVSNPSSVVSDAGVAGYTNYYRLVARDVTGLSSDRGASATLSLDLYPSAPVSLAATPSNNAVTLVWVDPPGTAPIPSDYRIYRSTVAGAVKTPIATLVPPAQYVDAAVTPGMAYYYQVVASNVSGEGHRSLEFGALALTGPSLAITPSSSRNTLVWTQPLPTPTHQVYGYTVYRAQSPSTVMIPLVGLVYGAATSIYVDSSVSSGQTYTYQVAPSTSSGALGGFSGPVVQSVLPQAVQLTVTSGDGLVQLRWTYQGGGTTTYKVQRRLGTDTDANFKTIQSGITGTDFLDTGLENKTFYTYRVITVASASVTSVNVDALPARPPTVTNGSSVTADPQSSGVYLTWTPANTASFDPTNQYPLAGYKIFRSTDGGGTYVYLGSVPANQTNYLDPVDVLSGDTRTYLVRAYDVPPNEPTMTHETAYPPVRVDSLTALTALDRNALRPFGLPNEQKVKVRYIVSAPGQVTIKVYSLSGTYVATLLDQYASAGIHDDLFWYGKNTNGQLVASGVYLITTKMPNRTEVNKIAVVK